MPDLTARELRDIEEMNALFAEPQEENTHPPKKDFAGSVESKIDQDNVEASIKSLDTPEVNEEEYKVAEEKSEEPEQVEVKKMFDAEKYKEEARLALQDDTRPPLRTKEDLRKLELEKVREEQNEKTKIASYSEVERLYYDNLDEESFKAKESLLTSIQDLESNEDNYETVSYMAKTHDGFEPRTRRTMLPEAKARMKQARVEYQEIVRPVNEKYLSIINSRIEDMVQKKEASRDRHSNNLGSNDYRAYEAAERHLEKARRRVEDNLSGAGAWGAMLSEAQDPDFYTVGLQATGDAVSLLEIVIKNSLGRQPTEAEADFISAVNTNNDVQGQIDTNEAHSVLTNVMQTIPWMAQMALTSGAGGTVEKGVRSLVYKQVQKQTGNILKTGIKASTLKAIQKGGARAVGYTAGALAQASVMPSTMGDAADRYVGEIEIERDKEGNFLKAYMREELYEKVLGDSNKAIKQLEQSKDSYDEAGNIMKPEVVEQIKALQDMAKHVEPLGAVEASYKAVTNAALELFTERVIGSQIAKGITKSGFKDPLNMLPPGKFSSFIKSIKKTFGYDGLIPELLEEEAMIPLNALLVGDSNYSDLWDGHQQKDLFLQVAATGALMGGFGGIVNLPSRLANQKYYKSRKEMLRHFHEMKESDPSNIANLIDLSSSASEVTSLVSMQEKLRKEGRDKEADIISEKIMYNQMISAFDTDTIEEFEDALNELGKKPNLPKNVLNNIAKAKADIIEMKGTYEKYRGKKNLSTIMRLQANKIMSKKAEAELDNQASQIASEDMVEDIEAYAEKHKIKIPEGISLNQMFDAKYEASLEGDILAEYNAFKDKLNPQNIASLGAFQRVQMAKGVAQNFHKESRILFNEQTSPAFEGKIKSEINLNKALSKSKVLEDAIENNDEITYNKEFKRIVEENKGTLSENKIAEIKAKIDKGIAKSKALQQLKKQQSIQKEAEARKAEAEAGGQPNVKAKEIEAKIKTQKENVTAEKEDSETNEQEKLNKEFREQADSLEFAFNPEVIGKDEDTSEDTGVSFDLPKALSKNLTEAKKNLFKEKVGAMYELVKKELGHAPTFKDLVTKFANEQTFQQADEYYNVLAMGWELNGYKKTDFANEYNNIFDPFKALSEELMADSSIFEDNTEKTAIEIDAETSYQNNKKSDPVVGHNEEGTPIKRSKVDGLKTVTSELKLGFLAMPYSKTVDGKKTSSEELSSDGLVDFKRLLDPNKFGAGTKLRVGIPEEGVLAKTFINSFDSKNNPIKIPYNTWITEGLEKNPNFKETPEYRESVPMFAYDTDGTPVSYVHGIGWYNVENIGHAENLPLQAKIIGDARKEVSEFREQVLNGGISEIEIQSKDGLVYHNIGEGTPAMTINEANPESVIAVAMDSARLRDGNDFFNNDKRVIIGDKELKTGLIYDLRRIGINDAGQETWYPFEVLKQDADKENKISEENLSTLKWALATHLKLANYTSYFAQKKGSPAKDTTVTEITEKQAKAISKKILEETGYDLSTRADLRNFLRLYIPVNEMSFFQLSNQLFNADIETARKEYKNHTSIDGLGTNPNMVSIAPDGQVNNTGKKYQETVKDYFKTTVKSFNVGTAEEPIWATTIQPSIKFGYKTRPVSEIIAEREEVVEQKREKEIKSEKTLEDEASKFLEDMGMGDTTEFDLPLTIVNTEAIEGVFKTTPGVTIQQEGIIVDFLFNRITAAVSLEGGNKVNKEEVSQSFKEEYKNIVASKKGKMLEYLKLLQDKHASGDSSQKTLDLIRQMQENLIVFNNISENWDNIEEKAFAKMRKYTKIKDESFQEDMQVSLREKDYSKSSLEEDNKNKSSYRLRRFFAGMSERTPDGVAKKGFLGLPTFVGFNEVYDSVAQILSSPVETESNFETMIAKLNEAEASHKWLPDLIEKLEGADEQMKKEFVYNFTKHALSMKFAMYSLTPQGNYSLKVYDTNSSEITRLIRNSWSNNFKMTPLVTTINGEYAIDKDKARTLYAQYKGWDKAFPTSTEAKAWLKDFGITLSDDAFKEIFEKGMWYRGESISFEDMFTSKSGIFRLLGDYLGDSKKGIINKKETTFDSVGDSAHPHSDISGVLKALANIEGKYSNQTMTLSFRDNGKSIFGLTPNKFATDRVLQLKQYDEDGNNSLVTQLKKLSISKGSYMLDLLEGEQEFRNKFSVDHIGITSLKERGTNSSPFSNITDLSDIDHDLTKLTGLQDLKQGKVSSTVDKSGKVQRGGNGISMRMGRMFLPTMSDKSQMLLLNTGVFNFFKDKNKSFEVDSEDKIGFTPTLKELLFNQLVRPELDRITKFHSTVKSTNITGYDLGAQIFHFLPALNNIKNEKGERMIELMATSPEVFTAEEIEKEFRTQIDSEIHRIIASKVESKKKLWESNVVRNNKGKITRIKFFDDKYLAQRTETLDEKFDLAIYDFILNSMLANSNMYSLLAGDPAVYSQDKLFKNFDIDNIEIKRIATIYGKENVFGIYPTYSAFLKELDKLELDGRISEKLAKEMRNKIKPIPTSGSDAAYLSLSENIGVNLGKRLALLIAPGSKLANSKGQKYMQVFLKDSYHMAENMEYLVELYHGKEALASVQEQFDEYRNSDNQTIRANLRATLAKKFPDLADYFDIESTDAQEYSTVEEHINILEGQGRIPDAKMKEIREALANKKDLTKDLLGFVLQPIKPVYTGQIIDEAQDVARTMYIKSSSFPLLPQLTKGRKLDNLRIKLEALESEYKMPVRASYQSANKVGSMNNPIDIFNQESLDTAEESALTLDRDNFRIQQDVPFKSDKNREDKVSMGTQIFKLLFGDGMIDLDGFKIKDKPYTGRQLYDHYNDTFSKIVALKKKSLYRELGLKSNGMPIDAKKSIEKIQKLLQNEAIDKGYPRQDIEGLTFVEKRDANNQPYYDFKLPLWLSANSNKYESLLNSIVTNRLIKQKLPGNSFVLGTEEGMELSETKEGIEDSRIVLVGDYKGGELKGVRDKDGKFTYAEMLVPSKFKNNKGELIDLFEKRGGTYIYLEKTEEGLKLKEDMISEELLTNFTYRTPTSAHVSASIVKIVGILPPENGDLMIVPKNFIKQKGLDYDVDKETAYQLWSVRNKKSGSITALTKSHKDEAVARVKQIIKDNEKNAAEDRLLKAILGENYDEIMGDPTLEEAQKIEAVNDEFEQKLLENEFIRINKSVYENPNEEVQKKINKVLSITFASGQADFIEGLNNEGVDKSDFTILDDSYQKSKMELGAAGKLAIGVYSNYVTFHSLAQQLNLEDSLTLMEETEEGMMPKTFRIGNFLSDGKIGRLNALGNNPRSIAEAFAEKQNTATDNEKEQILGRVNVNGVTINVDSILTLLGFDKGETINGQETSIPYLFLSQPIIKEYVKKIQENKAITSDYVYNAEEKIIEALQQKYNKGYTADESLDYEARHDALARQMTSENLIKEITSNGDIPGLQGAILNQFLELNTYARELSSVQSTVNTTSLGKSIIESNDKFNKLQILPRSKKIKNAEKLIGNYIAISEDVEKPEGYIKVGKYYVKPTTPQGQIVVNGIVTGNSLWNQYFPYSDSAVITVMDEIMAITNSEQKSDRSKIELQYEIFKEMKRYLNSNTANGLFSNAAGIEREGLFIDSKDNISLANYLNSLKNGDAKSKGISSVINSRLIGKFQYNLNTNGEPSTIFYNNSESQSFDEDYLYNSMAEMVVNAYPLPDKNNKPYNTKMLVADLVAYAYSEGGVQEVIQFVKYIPIEYLDSIGFNRVMQNYSPKSHLRKFKSALGIKELTPDNDNQTHTFVKQYMQHNPEKAFRITGKMRNKQFSDKVFDKENKKRMMSFTYNSKEGYPKFLSSRESNTGSNRKQDKESLFQHVGNGKYQRISILGAHGMQEYELGNENMHSILDKADPVIVKNAQNKKKSSEFKDIDDLFKIKEGNVHSILTKIGNYRSGKYKHFPKLVEFLMPTVKSNLKVVIGDTSEGGTRAAATARTIIDEQTGAITIMMDKTVMEGNDHTLIARAFIHEFIHSVTITELSKYFSPKTGKPLTDKLPLHISRLHMVFKEAQKQLGPELDALTTKLRKHSKKELPSNTEYSARELEVVYGGTSIFEFVTTALTEPSFQEAMGAIKYKATGYSVLHRFKVAVMNLLGMSGVPIDQGSITFEALDRIMDFIEIEAEANSANNTMSSTSKVNRYTTKEWREAQEIGEYQGIEDGFTKDINNYLATFEMPRTQETKNKIDEIFSNSKAIQKIGSKEDYSKFLALTGGTFKVDIQGFKNYKKGLTSQILDSLPDICG